MCVLKLLEHDEMREQQQQQQAPREGGGGAPLCSASLLGIEAAGVGM